MEPSQPQQQFNKELHWSFHFEFQKGEDSNPTDQKAEINQPFQNDYTVYGRGKDSAHTVGGRR